MLLITRHEVIRTSSVSTFQEHVVIGVARAFHQETCRNHSVTVVLDELQQLLTEALANPQFRAGKHFAVFLQDGPGDIQAGRLGNAKQQDSALQPGRPGGSRNQHIRVDDQTQGKHYRFGFREREALMIWSIWRELKVLVPLRSDSSPSTRKTSGSGAASLT